MKTSKPMLVPTVASAIESAKQERRQHIALTHSDRMQVWNRGAGEERHVESVVTYYQLVCLPVQNQRSAALLNAAKSGSIRDRAPVKP